MCALCPLFKGDSSNVCFFCCQDVMGRTLNIIYGAVCHKYFTSAFIARSVGAVQVSCDWSIILDLERVNQ